MQGHNHTMCMLEATTIDNRRDIRSSTSQEAKLEEDLEGAMATEKPSISLLSSPGMSQQPTVPRVSIPESEALCDIPVKKLPEDVFFQYDAPSMPGKPTSHCVTISLGQLVSGCGNY